VFQQEPAFCQNGKHTRGTPVPLHRADGAILGKHKKPAPESGQPPSVATFSIFNSYKILN